MERFQGLIGIALIFALAIGISRNRRHIKWRTLAVGLAMQVAFAFLVLKWEPGFKALSWVASGLTSLINFTDKGTQFVFGGLLPTNNNGFVFALNVLPVIVFFGALIGALYYLRVIQLFVDIVGTGLQKLLGISKIEGVWASTVIFLGQTEAPLMIAPYIRKLTKAELFTCMTGGFAAVAGSTLIGYSLLGAPLPYLLAASVMNAPGSLIMAKALMPEMEEPEADANVRNVRDTESRNVIDALGNGALNGGRIAVCVACLLIAFIALIALVSAIIGGIGGWFGHPEWTLEGLFGVVLSPVAWVIGAPWEEAGLVGNFIGQKTVLNEFVGYTAFSQQVATLSPKAVLISSFALAGFANFSSIAIQIGAFGSLVPERRGEVAKLGPLALLAGMCTNLLNAAIVGVVMS
ncbi:NupC/NupG family nucleoside CNT transporter [Dermatophilus congolensis]|uniref:Nucleoside permease nupX n=2 Tax=Dermatophilus congolensis TaxID=1863 RepID=A0AA46BLW3_9MICO|nr:nucleoside transporter C-terminal domain-containing protein [Dermatophilus congolensis]MBO3142205.1 NupC/NupG family nucleoside CNT transporter [Dermatophilus congolensis]MBO3151197.1 NupC/NupG family nucleoside CNT transporter [Dermatophilus congolensis]MBO3161802.1 NupC/NupG family nucleoside CNT transporter [Dermatophilus congolensis]MBO3162480.1 NupC/NupG family nucleoside CNT transporter [Dermatophilus congolensis]MBO3176036.1 NupC/NupG family nucleoside CNT transporter [Dermatophilus 